MTKAELEDIVMQVALKKRILSEHFGNEREGDPKFIVDDGTAFDSVEKAHDYYKDSPSTDEQGTTQILGVGKYNSWRNLYWEIPCDVLLITDEPEGRRETGIMSHQKIILFSALPRIADELVDHQLSGFYDNVTKLADNLEKGPKTNPGYCLERLREAVRNINIADMPESSRPPSTSDYYEFFYAFQVSEDIKRVDQFLDKALTANGLPTDIDELSEKLAVIDGREHHGDRVVPYTGIKLERVMVTGVDMVYHEVRPYDLHCTIDLEHAIKILGKIYNIPEQDLKKIKPVALYYELELAVMLPKDAKIMSVGSHAAYQDEEGRIYNAIEPLLDKNSFDDSMLRRFVMSNTYKIGISIDDDVKLDPKHEPSQRLLFYSGDCLVGTSEYLDMSLEYKDPHNPVLVKGPNLVLGRHVMKEVNSGG